MEGFDDLFDDQFLDSVWQPMMNGGGGNNLSASSFISSTSLPSSSSATVLSNTAGGTNNNNNHNNMVFDMDDLMNGDFLDSTMLGNTNSINGIPNNSKITVSSNNTYTNTFTNNSNSGRGNHSTTSSSVPDTSIGNNQYNSNGQKIQQSISPGALLFGGQPNNINTSLNTSQHHRHQEISPFSTQFLSSPTSSSGSLLLSSATLLNPNHPSSTASTLLSNNRGNTEIANQYSISRTNVFALNVLPTTNYAQHQVGAAVVNNNSSNLTSNGGNSGTPMNQASTGDMNENTNGLDDNANPNDNDFDDNDLDDDDLEDDDYNGGGGGGNKSGTEGGGGSGKFTSSTNAKLLSLEERRLKRLERNRESARQSRQRKKQYLALLEGRVVALQQQIYELRSSHASAAYQMLEEQRQRLLFSLEQLAYKDSFTPEEEASVQDAAVQLVDRFGPDCAERRAVREFHFDQLHRLLLPPHTKFLLWLIHQPNDFFTVNNTPIVTNTTDSVHSTKGKPIGTDKNKKNINDYESNNSPHSPATTPVDTPSNRPSITLWTLLCAEIGLANDQAERFRSQLRRVLGGPDLPRETWRLGVAAAYLQRLRVGIAASAAKAQSHLEKVAEILTPAQLIRYLAWMERNKDRVSKAIEQTVVSPLSSTTVPNNMTSTTGIPTSMNNS